MKRNILVTLAILVSINMWGLPREQQNIIKYPGYSLVWAEEFDYKGLPNADYWNFHEGYERNSELQDFRKANLKYAHVKKGRLILKAYKDPHEGINKWTKEPYHFDFSSAEVVTDQKVSFKYGRIDVSAKLPTGRGIWPAIWMMPVKSVYGGWSRSGEIDIIEYVWGIADDHQTVAATVHTEDIDINKNKVGSGYISCNTLSTEFHLYSLVWKENHIEILFDNQVIFTYEKTTDNSAKWPFDQDFYLMLNISVGGSWGGTWGIDDKIFPAKMEIDYVRYYKEDK